MSTSPGPVVDLSVDDDGVAVVTVDNPPVNALTDACLTQLAEKADAIASDESVRAVVLTGTGERAFMAGADLRELRSALGDRRWLAQHQRRTRSTLARWEDLPQPVIAAVQAPALGGGLELALVCTLVVADPLASFALPEIRLGLIPGAGGTQRLPQRIPHQLALEMLLLGEPIDASEALRLGLVNRVSAPGCARAEAVGLAAQIARLPVGAVRAAIDATRRCRTPSADGLDREAHLFEELFCSADAEEGIAAFLDRRPPVFGRRESGSDPPQGSRHG